MPERDWQADMELCCKVQELMRKYEGYVPVDVLERKLDFPMQALKGWPAALEERARLEARVKELEAIIELCVEIECPQCFAYGPDVFGNSYCNKEKSGDCGIYKLKEVLNGA